MLNKVVARYVDGPVVKGTTADFFPNKEIFHLSVTGAAPDRNDLEAAASSFVNRLDRLLETVQSAPFEQPSRILLTGGGSTAPYVADAVRARYPGVELVRGEPSLAIVSGLAKAASLSPG